MNMIPNNLDILDLFTRMSLIRETENLIQRHYTSNIFKTPTHLSTGAEAIACGILAHFPKRRLFGTYRNHHWYVEAAGGSERLFQEMLGKESSPAKGRAGSMHLLEPERGIVLNSAIVASTVPIAVGDAWAGMQKKDSGQTICFFGDGATEEGVFWEALNFAALKKTRILFVCEDNGLAIHSHKKDRQAFNLKNAVENYGILFIEADGAQVQEVWQAGAKAQIALEKGPVFLCVQYTRFLEHVGIGEDFNSGYRPLPPDLRTAHDPLWNCEQQLLRNGIAAAQITQVKNEARARIEQDFVRASAQPDVGVQTAQDYVFKGAL